MSSSATLVKFFHGRARSPVFSCMVELGSFSSDLVEVGLPINKASSPQLNVHKARAAQLQSSQIKEK